MEDKITAIYVMARLEELTPEDHGSYDRLLAEQKAACLQVLKGRFSEEEIGHIEVYTSRKQLLMDVERERIKRLAVERVDRLGASTEDIEAILFELRSQGLELVTVASGKSE